MGDFHKKKKRNQWESGPSNAPNQNKGKAPLQLERPNKPQDKKDVAKDGCLHCGKKGHSQKKCPDWLEMMWKKGATTHVSNSMRGLSMSRMLQRGERGIKVANGVEAEVEAIGELPIKLKDGFTLRLHDVLYVPTLSRNLISVSCLSDYDFECRFDSERCLIMLSKVCVGLAFRQDKLYMLFVHDDVYACEDV
ncbi:unnamed protein product, partial [Urochloa humidicola]